ncbi:MAG: rpoE 1, partial [Planctomycetaceae bacterium]|nr:rpoE 1 [Planctomycetaceae bacterium]
MSVIALIAARHVDDSEFMIETRISLIQRVRNNADSSAWDEFFATYHPLLLAYVRKRGITEHDAADIIQDVFSRLVPALAQFEFDAQRGRFRTWLWRVTANALADWGRRDSTRGRAERGWVELHQPANDGDSDSEWNSLYRRRTVEVVLERVRATAHPVTWACFESRILAGRPAAEIASEVGVSVNSVYVNASRILNRVREE